MPKWLFKWLIQLAHYHKLHNFTPGRICCIKISITYHSLGYTVETPKRRVYLKWKAITINSYPTQQPRKQIQKTATEFIYFWGFNSILSGILNVLFDTSVEFVDFSTSCLRKFFFVILKRNSEAFKVETCNIRIRTFLNHWSQT